MDNGGWLWIIKHSFIWEGRGRQENNMVLYTFLLHLTSGPGFKTVKHEYTDLCTSTDRLYYLRRNPLLDTALHSLYYK